VRVTEQAQLLGPRRTLVGIVTEPPPGAPPDRPAVVVLNSGIVHRVGANRMTVSLARALAAQGHRVVRFDLSGIGDSPPRSDALSPIDAGMADIREVLDTLEGSRGVRQVVLAGLCSGADAAVLYAGGDPRVVGAALLDPSMPDTRRHRLLHYRSRALSATSWLNVLSGKNRFLRGLLDGARRVEGPPQPSLQDPEIVRFLSGKYQAALDAGVRLLAVLSRERCYYREHLLDAFPSVAFGDRLQLEHLPTADHTFSASEDRARVIRLLVEWAGATPFGRGAGRT
jgi:pimeloyl-ACP methyl ester carboxylesterase